MKKKSTDDFITGGRAACVTRRKDGHIGENVSKDLRGNVRSRL